jgi:hypothetical protein
MPPNILLIQDDPLDAKAVRDALINSSDGSFQVEWVRRCSEGLERLAREAKQEKQEKQRTDAIAAVLIDLFCPTATELTPSIGSFAQRPRFRSWSLVQRKMKISPSWRYSVERRITF